MDYGNSIFAILLLYPKEGLLNNITDISIIKGIQKQDEKILNWLYDNYFQLVRSHVFENKGNSDDVSDVFQDSIIILYRQITEENLNLTTDLKGYFFGIVRNVWMSHLRKKLRTTGLEIDIIEDDEIKDIYDPVLERIVSRAFNMLKPDQQKVLSLFSEGHSFTDIALKLDLKNEANARRIKYRCKEALLEIMHEDPEYQEYLRFLK